MSASFSAGLSEHSPMATRQEAKAANATPALFGSAVSAPLGPWSHDTQSGEAAPGPSQAQWKGGGGTTCAVRTFGGDCHGNGRCISPPTHKNIQTHFPLSVRAALVVAHRARFVSTKKKVRTFKEQCRFQNGPAGDIPPSRLHTVRRVPSLADYQKRTLTEPSALALAGLCRVRPRTPRKCSRTPWHDAHRRTFFRIAHSPPTRELDCPVRGNSDTRRCRAESQRRRDMTAGDSKRRQSPADLNELREAHCCRLCVFLHCPPSSRFGEDTGLWGNQHGTDTAKGMRWGIHMLRGQDL